MGKKQGEVISNAEYRSRDGVSSTELKKIAKSPAHYRYWKDHPQADTPALLFGRASHKYMLEKEDFFKEFAVAPNVDRRTKAGKEEWALFEVENQGKDIISADDFEKIKEMYEALYSTPFVAKLLSGEKELSYFLEDDDTGLIIKCRPDCETHIGDTHILIDYKTTDNANSDDFMKQAIKLMYDMQLYMYSHILEKIKGFKYDVVFIAQEKNPPYAVNIMKADKYFMASGEDMFKTYINIYKECLETDNWYAYVNDSINSLGLPNWLQKQYSSVDME